MREISLTPLSSEISKFLPLLPDLGLLDQFKEASLLKENLFNSLVVIIKNVGKKIFRPHVELFIDSAFRTAKGTMIIY